MNERIERLYNYESINDLLTYWAKNTPHNTAYVYLQDRTFEEREYSFQQLYIRSLSVAAKLQETVEKGDRVLLLFPSGLEYIESFLGCLLANVIAVPAYLPRNQRDWVRVDGIIKDSGAKAILTNTMHLPKISEHVESNINDSKLPCIDVENINKEYALRYSNTIVQKNDVAFIQYTSGSTGQPKGVMVSHFNLLHNQTTSGISFGHDASTIGFGWLPLYHDMGLIGNVLHSLVLGVPLFFMSPYSFVQKPFRWLEFISKYKATSSGGPNFAYDLCTKKITNDEISQLDLSSWEMAFCGSEPIRKSTLQGFVDRFSACGFKESSFFPCYGMAENTLIITGSKPDKNPQYISLNTEKLSNRIVDKRDDDCPDTTAFVGCGSEFNNQDIRIVDPETHSILSEGNVGEVWIKGKSVTLGYWNDTDKTDNTFNCYTSDTNEGPFLRSGDLAFIQDGELYITGRIKDVIIINGRNYVPQDIEMTTFNTDEALIIDGTAAFPFNYQEKEEFVVVQEVARTALKYLDIPTLGKAVRKHISDNHQLVPHQIVFIKPASLPRTTSGKIQRSKCKALYDTGNLKIVGVA